MIQFYHQRKKHPQKTPFYLSALPMKAHKETAGFNTTETLEVALFSV